MLEMKFTALVTILSVVLVFVLTARAGALRGKHGIAAPACIGNEEFERVFRAQANTVEHMVMFVPMLWLALNVIGDVWAASIGGIWIIGRIIYCINYIKQPDTRLPGFVVAIAALVILSLSATWGVAQALLP